MTKKMKKVLSLLMVVAMLLSLGLNTHVAQAEGPGKITLKNTVPEKNYNLYRIFDLTHSADGSNVAYTIATKWTGFFAGTGAGYIENTNTGDLNPIVVGGEVKYINITDDNVAEFAKAAFKYAKENGITPDETPKGDAGTTTTVDNLALGYYLIEPEGATQQKPEWQSVVSLTSTKPEGEAFIKGDYPTIDKEVVGDETNVDIGDPITYKLTGEVPDTTGYKTYKYNLKDTLSRGLDFVSTADDVVIKVGDIEIAHDNPAITAININTEEKVLTIEFDMTKLQDHVGKELVITYQAKLNDQAIAGDPNGNNVVLEYENQPEGDTTTAEVDVYTGAIDVIKVDGKDNTKKLEGAEFILYKVLEGEGEPKEYYTYTPENGVDWVENEADAKIEVTDANGKVTFKGLKAGTYYLKEKTAPDGYNLLTEDKEVIITEGEGGAVGVTETTVLNNAGTVLPGTGGAGRTAFAVFGSGVLLLAVVVFAKSKLKREGNY